MDQLARWPGESLAKLHGSERISVEIDGGGAIAQDKSRRNRS
jgi:hypothetical protein